MVMEKIPPILASSGAIEIAERLKLISGGKILDIATGDGDSILSLINFLKNYNSVIGVDIDENEIKKARFRLKDKPITIQIMNAEKLEYPDNTFDLVNIAYSLHHMQNLNKTLSEMKRVLKKGGHFIIKEMFCDGNQTDAQKYGTEAHEFGAEIDRMLGIYHREEYTRDELLNILSQIELKDLEILESTRDAKCLKCEDKYNCEDPKHPGLINITLKEIDTNLERIKEYKEYSNFRERAEIISQRIKNHGVASTSILFCIGKKKGLSYR
jgi:ubiquinone/menaquinone biosynthesis C-methylase UbiE